MTFLPFQRELTLETTSRTDRASLFIVGNGLGLERVLESLITIHADKRNLVLLQNMGEISFKAILNKLQAGETVQN